MTGSVLRTVSVRGLGLAYHTWGEAGRRPLVFLHGHLDHGLSFLPVAELLGDRFFVVAPDLRGHGHSDWVGAGGYYYFYDYFDDVITLLDHLAPGPALVVGHSMGGGVAAGVAAMRPDLVSSLILLEGMGPPYTPIDGTIDRLRTWATTVRWPAANQDVAGRRASRKPMASVDEAARKMLDANPRLSETAARQLASTFTEELPAGGGVVWRYDPLHRSRSPKPYRPDEARMLWANLGAPVLSVFGTETQWMPDDIDERHAAIPRLVTGLIRGAGHNMHHERPELIAAIVESWDEAPMVRPRCLSSFVR